MSIIEKDEKLYDTIWDMAVDEFEDCVLSFDIKKIKNGSLMTIGGETFKTQVKADQHFNWFQKLMWKWCFGVKVEDYSEE